MILRRETDETQITIFQNSPEFKWTVEDFETLKREDQRLLKHKWYGLKGSIY